MKTLANANARNLEEAVALAQEARREGQAVSFAGGGTDLLQLVKDKTVNRPGSGVPDVLVNLKTVSGLDEVTSGGDGVSIGGLTTLDALSRHPLIRAQFTVLAEAAESVASPQIRNVGTLAGNVCQRPWCWYYRNGFPCYKAGGNQCFSFVGENQLHAIFGGGPSFIVHPSDTAPALVALDARFEIVGPDGERTLSASEFFVLPSQDPEHENVLGDDEVLASVELPTPRDGVRSTYHKIMDREAWTHALVSAGRGAGDERRRLPGGTDRAGRRGAHSLAGTGGREVTGRPARHARARQSGWGSCRGRGEAPVEERLQGAAHQRGGRAYRPHARRVRLNTVAVMVVLLSTSPTSREG